MASLNVLYISHDSRAGSAMSLYNMISALGGYVNPIVLLKEDGPLIDLLRERHTEYILFPFTTLERTYSDKYYHRYFPKLLLWYIKTMWREAKAIKRLLNGRKIDIVHTNNSHYPIGLLLAHILGAKHVWHIREFLTIDHGIKVFGGISNLRRIIKRSDAIIAISTPIYLFWKLGNKKAVVVGDAVKKTNERMMIMQKQKYILFCAATITEKKGALFAADSFFKSTLPKEGYKLKMIGACNTTLQSKLVSLAQKHNAAGNLQLIPYATELRDYYANATALIMASDNEALGRVTIEAMFFGCPVIARNSGGTTDIVKDDVTGYLFDDIDTCSELLNKVAHGNNQELIKRAQAYVVENYSEECFRSKILGVYSNVLTI